MNLFGNSEGVPDESTLLPRPKGVAMGFSIHYRSTEPMHPARAFEIKQHAEQLSRRYAWLGCEPISLHQQTNGFLEGHSRPVYYPAEVDVDAEHLDGLPDGTVLSLAEVLCELSRSHGVSWEIGHDYDVAPIGRIQNGQAKIELIEQLETFGTIGDLLDELVDEPGGIQPVRLVDDTALDIPTIGLADDLSDSERDEEGPRVIKFPGPGS